MKKRKYTLLILILSLAVLFVSGCSAQQNNTGAGNSQNGTPTSNASEDMPQESENSTEADQIEETPSTSDALSDTSDKVLIIYFSNSGNTERVANIIQEKTDGILYEIKTIEEYPGRPELLDVAKKQLEEGYLPPLEGELPSLETYEYIFVGSPVWWLNPSPPVLSFLSSFDFNGKKVILFCTNLGGTGEYFTRFAEEAKNADIIGDGKVFSYVDSKETTALEDDISSWLETVFTDGGE